MWAGLQGRTQGPVAGVPLLSALSRGPPPYLQFTWILSYWEAIHTAIPTEELEREDFFQMPKSS